MWVFPLRGYFSLHTMVIVNVWSEIIFGVPLESDSREPVEDSIIGSCLTECIRYILFTITII